MIINNQGKQLTQGAVITSVTELDQWSIQVTIVGPGDNRFELIFSHDDWDRMLNRGMEVADCIVTLVTSAADPTYIAYSVDPRGAAGLKVFIQRKLEDPYYEGVHTNDYVMHARRYGFAALRFEQLPGLFTLSAGKAEGERRRRQFLEGTK